MTQGDTPNNLTDTVTVERIDRVVAQKAKSLLRYIRSYKAGQAPWVAPNTELILLEDGFDVINAAYKEQVKLVSYVLVLSLLDMVYLNHSR